MYNGLLERQLKRYLKETDGLSEEFKNLLQAISHAYDHYEEDRKLVERSLEISSYELTINNRKLAELNRQVEEKNSDLLSSIRYAKMIQEAILPPESVFKSLLRDHFIFYRPKEIVSGDFYWIEEFKEQIMVAAVDCTGHGVPGAFMSIVGHNLLTSAVRQNQLTKPDEILNLMNDGVNSTLRQTNDELSIKDGMDMALLNIDLKKMSLQYAGAYNPVYLFRDKKLFETKADKFPVGITFKENFNKFTNHKIPLQKGDVLYIFTDGFADQFGGPFGKKFKYDQYKSLLMDIHQLPCEKQKEKLETTLNDWMGDLVQIDDVLIMGIKI